MRISGKNSVYEAVMAGRAEKVTFAKGADVQQIIDLCKQKHVQFTFMQRSDLDKICEAKNHQGVTALVTDFVYSDLNELIAYAKGFENPFIVVLDGIEDPHNLGSIIRTAECAGVHGIVIPARRAASVNETVVKTSAGASAYVKIAKVTNISQTIETLKSSGFWTYALETKAQNIYEDDLSGAAALVIGGEDSGVRSLVMKSCDKIITLPIFGKVNSLNASVAAGIAIYEKIRHDFLKRKVK